MSVERIYYERMKQLEKEIEDIGKLVVDIKFTADNLLDEHVSAVCGRILKQILKSSKAKENEGKVVEK